MPIIWYPQGLMLIAHKHPFFVDEHRTNDYIIYVYTMCIYIYIYPLYIYPIYIYIHYIYIYIRYMFISIIYISNIYIYIRYIFISIIYIYIYPLYIYIYTAFFALMNGLTPMLVMLKHLGSSHLPVTRWFIGRAWVTLGPTGCFWWALILHDLPTKPWVRPIFELRYHI